MPKTLPVARWHSMQLQAATEPGLPLTVTLSWPQERLQVAEPPVCVATVHPSAVLRSRTRDVDLAALVADLRAAVDLL